MTMLDMFRRNGASVNPDGGVNAALLNELIEAHASCLKQYQTFRNYWNGEHAVRLTDRLKQFLVLNKFDVTGESSKFSDNFCGVVVAALVDRLTVQAFTVPGEDAGDPETTGGAPTPGKAAKAATDWWALNRGARLEKRVYEHSAALGDAFVMVEWDVELKRPRLSFNTPEEVRVYYAADDSQRMDYATKRWTITTPGEQFGMVRLNVYYPDRIEKYIARAQAGGAQGQWQQHSDEGETAWPLPWLDKDGNPLGIPVAHFRNDDRGGDYGRSELADMIPLQDVLNKALVDGVKIEDSQGWAQRWATGIQTEPDANKEMQPGTIAWAPSVDAKFGQFDASDPTLTIAWMEHLVSNIANVTATPHHLFHTTGTLPSGESLKTAEAPLVTKARDRQGVFGDAWEDVMVLCVRLHNANVGVVEGVQAIDLPDTGFEVTWGPAETRPSEKEHIETVNLKMGISDRQRMREYGYSEEEIDRMLKERGDEQATTLEIEAAAFDAGAPATGRPRARSAASAK